MRQRIPYSVAWFSLTEEFKIWLGYKLVNGRWELGGEI